MGMEHGGNPREGTLVSHGFLNGSLGERRSKSSPSISRTINVNPKTTDHDYGFSFLSFSFLFFFFFAITRHLKDFIEKRNLMIIAFYVSISLVILVVNSNIFI